jgi:phage gp36-like protein
MTAAYATLADLYVLGAPLVSMGQVSVATQQACLDARNDYADDKLRARYKLPLGLPYPPSLRQNICILAAYDVMNIRGYNPAAGADVNLVTRAEQAMKWFDDVERQRAHPNVIEASGGTEPGYAAPEVISKPLQGWYPRSA